MIEMPNLTITHTVMDKIPWPGVSEMGFWPYDIGQIFNHCEGINIMAMVFESAFNLTAFSPPFQI